MLHEGEAGMEVPLIHPLTGDEAVGMLAAALCEADAEQHTGLETAVPCQHHLHMSARVLEALSPRTREI
jgi:hypothetical protein